VPELPDIVVYMEALDQRITGQTLERIRVTSPFLLRSVDPPLPYAESKRVHQLRRTGKRIALGLDEDLWLVFHLMIAGRLHWRERRDSPTPRALAVFDFSNGRLWLTEAGTQRRASLHLVTG
jgi:formamidopyrimidine-DNA glycosylase